MVEGRARSAKERRLEAAHKMGLLEEPDHVRALVAPWQLPKGEDRISKLLGLDETSDGEEGEGEGEDAAETLHSTRLLNAEASRLGVPLTSEPYKKLRRFSDSLSELSASLCFSLSASSENVLSESLTLPLTLCLQSMLSSRRSKQRWMSSCPTSSGSSRMLARSTWRATWQRSSTSTRCF